MEVRGIASMKFEGNLYENWLFFKQRFENYLKATDVINKPESMIGEEGFHTYNTFKFAATEKDKLKPLIDKFTAHFKPKSNVANERCIFFSRRQQPNESVNQYITVLQNKAKQCSFGELEDSLIKTCITCGVRDEVIKHRLLEDETTEAAVRICKSLKKGRCDVR